MKLFSHEKLVITVDEIQDTTYVKEVWSGVFTSTVFRRLVENSLEIYREHVSKLKCSKCKFLLFADITNLEMINAKDIIWLTDVVNPQYEAIGFTEQAVIIPKSQIAQTTVLNYKGETREGGFNTQLFNDDLSAIRWFTAL
jgi:hypothetical protein